MTTHAHSHETSAVSLSYWTPTHDICQAECRATWAFDPATRREVWNLFKNAPAPVGYDPAIMSGWTSPTVESFAALRLEPWRLRLLPGTALGSGSGGVSWRE